MIAFQNQGGKNVPSEKAFLLKGFALLAFWGQASFVMPQEVMLNGFQASVTVRSGDPMPGGAVFPENPQGAVFCQSPARSPSPIMTGQVRSAC